MRTKNPIKPSKSSTSAGKTKPRAKESAKDSGPALYRFESMNQCAAATGIALSTIRRAAKEGCLAFEHSRVTLGPLLRWLSAKGDDSGTNWGEALKEAQAKRERLRLAKDEGRLADRGEIQDGIAKCMALLFGELDRQFLSELPAVLVGLTPIEIRTKAGGSIENLKGILRRKMDEVGEQNDEAK